MPKSARSFADDLRARSDDQLRVLLTARPDLTRPAPGDLTSLAARAATRGSVQRALDGLSADHLRVLEAVLVGGSEAAPKLLSATKRAVQAACRSLWDRALLWRSPEGYRPCRAVSEILSSPARLGPPARDLGVPDRSADAPAAYENLSEAARSAIDRLLWRHPRASFEGASATGVLDELLAAGLVVRTDDGGVIPREVGLALRGGRLYADGIDPPAVPTEQLSAHDVDADAAAAALDILWRVDTLVRLWDQSPPRVLRSGGLSVRDHRAAASALDADLELAAFVIEIAYAARLIANDGDFEPSWLPTTAYDDWVDADTGTRWAAIATGWLDSSRAASLAGTSTDQGTINVLSTEVGWPMMRSRRRDVLEIMAAPGQSVTVPAEYVDAMLHWKRPLRLPAGAPTRSGEVLREAAWLGVTGRGVLSGPGRALLAGQDAAAAMTGALPAPVDHLLLQADLTAVAPGPLTDELHSLMQAAADVESRGGATVYRFTDKSIRRALDAGRSATELIEQLTVASPTPVPQPLEYLIADVARRHGQTRVGTATCYLRNDDPATLDAMTNDRNLSALQLRKIAPTVVVSPAHPTTVLEMLRQHGYSPVAEGQDGHVVHVGSNHSRAAAPRGSEPPRLDAVTDELIDQVIAHARRGEQASAGRALNNSGPRIPSTDPTVTLAMLQDAASEQSAVWIGYSDTDGALHRTLFRPHRADGGRVTGVVGDGSESRTFSIHRITGVAPA
ncbi:MAG TPA: helicase-associated domain-containing protein [Flexivirga sp.]|uniref:helicase-associated domain-containing protein n=1 Tax=Flexivirga sp. TaxID=1962927 RepID=UPI002C11F297|nr:helicase-associated domain-containing protein [Flexivirga sp.]HWC22294.1 helicase-associated domain-containing protein [Flexivirga sp.]